MDDLKIEILRCLEVKNQNRNKSVIVCFQVIATANKRYPQAMFLLYNIKIIYHSFVTVINNVIYTYKAECISILPETCAFILTKV